MRTTVLNSDSIGSFLISSSLSAPERWMHDCWPAIRLGQPVSSPGNGVMPIVRVVVNTDLRARHRRITAAVQGTVSPPLGTPCRARGGPSPSPSSVCVCLPNSTEAGRSGSRGWLWSLLPTSAPASAPCGLNTSAESEPDAPCSASVSRAAPSGGGWRRCRPSAPRGEERGPAPHFLSRLLSWEGSLLLTPVSGLWSLRVKATQFSWI